MAASSRPVFSRHELASAWTDPQSWGSVHSIFAAIGELLHRYGYAAIIGFLVLEGSGIPLIPAA